MRFFLLLFGIILINKNNSYCQDNKWLVGKWTGSYLMNSRPTNFVTTILEINIIRGSYFEGTVESIWPKDTSVRVVANVSGIIYKKHVKLKQGERLYEKKFPNNRSWINCDICDSVKYAYVIKKKYITLTGERICGTNCNGIIQYSKKIEILPSLQNSPKSKLVQTTFNKEIIITNDTLQSDTKYAKRLIGNPIRYSVNADSAEIRLFDDGVIDGDEVTLLYNGKILVSKLILKASAYSIKIPIVKGQVNTFVLYAENLGTIPPNTAFLRILFDGKEIALNLSSDFIKSGAIEFVRSSSIEL